MKAKLQYAASIAALIATSIGMAVLTGCATAVLGAVCYARFAVWLAGSGEVARLVGQAVLWYALASPFRFLANVAAFALHALGEGNRVVRWKLLEVGLPTAAK